MCVTFRSVDMCSISKLKIKFSQSDLKETKREADCWAVNPNFIPDEKLWYISFFSLNTVKFLNQRSQRNIICKYQFTFTTNILCIIKYTSQNFPTSQSQWSSNIGSCGWIFISFIIHCFGHEQLETHWLSSLSCYTLKCV